MTRTANATSPASRPPSFQRSTNVDRAARRSNQAETRKAIAMSVTSQEIQPAAAAHVSFGPPWYLQGTLQISGDLRRADGHVRRVSAVSGRLRRIGRPRFVRTGLRDALDAPALHRAGRAGRGFSRALGIPLVHARPEYGRHVAERGNHPLFHADHVDQRLHLRGLLGRQLLRRAGQFLASGFRFATRHSPPIISSNSISTSRSTCFSAVPPGFTRGPDCRSTPRAFRFR